MLPARAQTAQKSAPPCPENAGRPFLWQCPRGRQSHPLRFRDSPSRITLPPPPARSIARAPCAAALSTTVSASPSAFCSSSLCPYRINQSGRVVLTHNLKTDFFAPFLTCWKQHDSPVIIITGKSGKSQGERGQIFMELAENEGKLLPGY